MAGTNAVAVKAELLRRLAVEPTLTGVDVLYVLGRDVGRECIYGGKVEGAVTAATMRDLSGGQDRDETPTIHLHIRVERPGGTDGEAEARAAELGAAVVDLVESDPTLSGAVPGLADLLVVGFEYDTGYADDEALIGLGHLQLAATSYL